MEGAVENENRVSADHRESRMRDIDDIEKAERDSGADAQRRIEAAHQQAGDQRIDEQRIGYRHGAALGPDVRMTDRPAPPSGNASRCRTVVVPLAAGIFE
jgi:hypothetical protein